MPQAFDTTLIATLIDAARHSARQRMNHNFHTALDAPCQRLLIAIEPDSYVAPHRHLDPQKAESLLLVRGTLGAVFFSDDGQISTTLKLSAAGECCGVDIPAGEYHSVVALEPGTVFFESKAGPYRPVDPAEFAAWAPREGDAGASAFREQLRALFR